MMMMMMFLLPFWWGRIEQKTAENTSQKYSNDFFQNPPHTQRQMIVSNCRSGVGGVNIQRHEGLYKHVLIYFRQHIPN